MLSLALCKLGYRHDADEAGGRDVDACVECAIVRHHGRHTARWQTGRSQVACTSDRLPRAHSFMRANH
ncbi:unnamed protein product [Arctia plantaginis]|uniref:Uncharacterized protein n=1 Tax=Arctia plantaginis TaxID=874455 RepID=A0A8S1BIN7_ARCPL|nr:unnamed protein product [Arctia plantaginis]